MRIAADGETCGAMIVRGGVVPEGDREWASATVAMITVGTSEEVV